MKNYKQSELISLLTGPGTMMSIAETLSMTKKQAERASKALYGRSKVTCRIEFMAQEIARLRRKDVVA